MAEGPWEFVVSKPIRDRLGRFRLPPADVAVSSIQFSNGQSVGTYVYVGDFLSLTIWQEVADPDHGADYVWTVVPSFNSREPPKFTVMAAPGVAISSGVGAELPLDLDTEPCAAALNHFWLHPLTVSQKRAGNRGDAPLPPWIIAPELDILRVQDRALLAGYGDKIRIDQILNAWPGPHGMLFEPHRDGISITSTYSQAGSGHTPVKLRISVPPNSGTDSFAFAQRSERDFTGPFTGTDRIDIVSTEDVICEVVEGSDRTENRFIAAQAKTLRRPQDRPQGEDVPVSTWSRKQGYLSTYWEIDPPYKVIDDGAGVLEAYEVFWPVIKLGTDFGIGMIPIVGDLVDLADFAKAVYSGSDKWGDEVGTFELALMGLAVLIPIAGSRTVREVGKGMIRVGGEGATAMAKAAGNATSTAFRMLEAADTDLRKLVGDAGYEPYLEAILALKASDIPLVMQAAEKLHDALKTADYVKRLEAKLPPKGRAPDVELPQNPSRYMDFFRGLMGAAKKVMPPAGALDDLLSDTGAGFRVPFLQDRYDLYLSGLRPGQTPLPPKDWLRNLHPSSTVRRYVTEWMGEKAARVEFGDPKLLGANRATRQADYFEAILDEASEGRTHLGRPFDWDRFPHVEGMTWPVWKPGWPIDMPTPAGLRPAYGEAARRGRRALAFFEFRSRVGLLGEIPLSDGTKLTVDRLKGADIDQVIAWAGDAEVIKVMKGLDDLPGVTQVGQPFWRGDMPFGQLRAGLQGRAMRSRANGGEIQFEHFKPQRTYYHLSLFFKQLGDDQALIRLSGFSNPNNLKPLPQLRHMEVDVKAANFAPRDDTVMQEVFLFSGGKRSLESFADDQRLTRPFTGWAKRELTEVVTMIKDRAQVPFSVSDQKKAAAMLDALRIEIRKRGMMIEVPQMRDLIPRRPGEVYQPP